MRLTTTELQFHFQQEQRLFLTTMPSLVLGQPSLLSPMGSQASFPEIKSAWNYNSTKRQRLIMESSTSPYLLQLPWSRQLILRETAECTMVTQQWIIWFWPGRLVSNILLFNFCSLCPIPAMKVKYNTWFEMGQYLPTACYIIRGIHKMAG